MLIEQEHHMLTTIQVTTTGSAGSATGSADSDIMIYGYVNAIKVDYAGTAPNTTDVTITELSGLARTLLTVTNSATDAVYYPSVATNAPDGTARTDYQRPYIEASRIRVSVAGSNQLTNCVTVTIQTQEH